MTIRFAAANTAGVSITARHTSRSATLVAANDNNDATAGDSHQLVRAALRHFAQHGLSAAERARENAEAAFFAGNSDDYRWWMAICTTLDRRMAAAVEFRRN